MALTSRSTSIAVPGSASPVPMGGWPAGRPPSASSCRSWAVVSRDGTVLSLVPLIKQVHHGGVGPQRDRGAGSVRTEPEMLPAHGQVAGGGHRPADLDGEGDRLAAVGRHHRRGRGRLGRRGARRCGTRCWPCGCQGGRQPQAAAARRRAGDEHLGRERHVQRLVRRLVLYSARKASTAACAVSMSGQTSTSSSSSRCRVW